MKKFCNHNVDNQIYMQATNNRHNQYYLGQKISKKPNDFSNSFIKKI